VLLNFFSKEKFMDQMFELASRKKIRFDTTKGMLTVEDLWDLPLVSTAGKACLDSVARNLHNELKETEEVSFVTPVTTNNDDTKLAFELVKYIISVKINEANAIRIERETREKKQKIMAIIDQKQDQALSAMSIDELSKLVESM